MGSCELYRDLFFKYCKKVESAIKSAIHNPPIEVKREWYYTGGDL